MTEQINVPPQLGEVVRQIIQRLNNEDPEIEIILIAVKSDIPPTMVASITPDSVKDVLQWLIDHHGRSTTSAWSLGDKPN